MADFMSWLLASLIAAGFLGLYDLCNKHAVQKNAVLPVLFLHTLCAALIWGCLLILQRLYPSAWPDFLIVTPLTGTQHLQILLKSAIVTSSWVCSYFAIKHLPVSLTSPIGATQPLFTLVGGLLLFMERPSHWQMLGMLVALGSFFGLSLAGRAEGVDFKRNAWVRLMLLGTLLGGISGLYDKLLLGRQHFTPSTVQAWFSIYLAILFLPLAIGWKRRWWPRGEFHWRWSIPGIAVALLISDNLYFNALRDPSSMISVVSCVRRGSVLVSFAGGVLLLGETNAWRKLPAIIGLLAGIWLMMLG